MKQGAAVSGVAVLREAVGGWVAAAGGRAGGWGRWQLVLEDAARLVLTALGMLHDPETRPAIC